ncbi:MAG: hypothetical protein ABL888_00545 [Pirellulaceae bacterium]
MNRRYLMTSTIVAVFLIPAFVVGQETKKPAKASTGDKSAVEDIVFKVADDQIEMKASGTWKKVSPKSNIVEVEFAIPKQGSDENDGRMTIMSSGGTVEANIDRWKGQFKNTDDDKVKVEKKTVNNLDVHVVDITGTFMDSMGGPAGPKTDRDNYRMLAAIVETKDNGLYFIKFYGPAETVGKNEPHFRSLIDSVKETK